MMHGRLLSFSSLVYKSFCVPLSRCCGLVVVTSFWLLVLRQHAGITATLTHVHFLEMWPEEYGVQFLWVEVVFLFIIEACADFVQLLFLFYLGVSNGHSCLFWRPKPL